MRFTLTAKLLAAFSALALIAALPGAGLLLGILRLERTTHENQKEVATRDACAHTRAEALAALTALQSHALFPEDPRFDQAAREHLTSVERAAASVQEGLDETNAAALASELNQLIAAAHPFLEQPSPGPKQQQSLQAAILV